MVIHTVDRTKHMNDQLRQSLERNLTFALSRFADEIEQITAKTEDINGPRGGIDKRCTLRAKTRRHGVIEVTQDCVSLGSGLARCARRLGHSVSRTIKQRQSFSRDSIRRLGQLGA